MDEPRHKHVDKANGPDRTAAVEVGPGGVQRVIVAGTYECRGCRIPVEHGKPCPKCGKQLLTD